VNKQYQTIDEYIKSFPGDIQARLKQLRALIQRAAPEAQEKISYQMPTFYQGAVQFPLDAPLPLKLIERIVKFRVKESGRK
jgi:uncharacterized protein YdhG (YjbR/CyaY superfamily)